MAASAVFLLGLGFFQLLENWNHLSVPDALKLVALLPFSAFALTLVVAVYAAPIAVPLLVVLEKRALRHSLWAITSGAIVAVTALAYNDMADASQEIALFAVSGGVAGWIYSLCRDAHRRSAHRLTEYRRNAIDV